MRLPHSMVMERGTVCCTAPEVATTETVEVTGLGLELPPQPESSVAPAEVIASASSKSFALRRFLQPMQQRARASVAPGSFPENGAWSRWRLAVLDAEMVRVVVATPPEGVTLGGANVQVAPAGRPVQLKVVAPVKPLCGVTEMVTVPLWPGSMVSEDTDVEMVNVGGGRLMV